MSHQIETLKIYVKQKLHVKAAQEAIHAFEAAFDTCIFSFIAFHRQYLS